MRVAMVILEYAPITGGAQRQLAALAPLLQRRGAEIHVLTRRQRGLAARETLDGVAVHRLPAPGPKPSASLAFTGAALARLAGLRPDVVHAFSLFSPATIALLARRGLGVGTVLKVLRGGCAGDVRRLRAKPLASRRVAELRRGIDRFVSISDEIDAELEALGVPAERRRRIPNGIDLRRYRPVSEARRRARRAELGLPEGPTVLYCGRFVPEKRLDLLLEAWRLLHPGWPKASLVLVGDGPEAEALRRRAGPGVHLVGEVREALPYYEASDLFVLPSDSEGLSNAMLEAMAVGLPVVATRVGAAPELLEPTGAGSLIGPGSAPELRAALEGLLADPARAERGARGREALARGHSLESVAERLYGLYEEVAALRPHRGSVLRPGRRELRA